MKHFCKSCGKTNLYQESMIMYCGYCGIKFNLNKSDKYASATTAGIFEEKPSINQIEKVKSVKPKFELVTYHDRGQNLGGVLGVGDSSVVSDVFSEVESRQDTSADFPSSTQKSRDQILQEFASESSTLRKEQINDK